MVIDVQEKLLTVMAHSDRVVQNSIRLIKGAQLLSLPILVTEQYPQGIGPTVASLKELLASAKMYEKLTFSACGIPDFIRSLRTLKVQKIILCGIETHVCVYQTAMDLLHEGFGVVVVADAASSRHDVDFEAALRQMSQSGVRVLTTEMVLFELMEKAGTEEFKSMLQIIKEAV